MKTIEKISFLIALPFTVFCGFLGAILLVPEIWKRIKNAEEIGSVVAFVSNAIMTTPPFSWYLSMPEEGSALVAIFFYSVLFKIFA